jgi:hypothetical protein
MRQRRWPGVGDGLFLRGHPSHVGSHTGMAARSKRRKVVGPSRHAAIAASSRSAMRRAGTCTLHYADIVVMPTCGRELLAAGAGGLAESA